ncbi:pyridoxal phosphate-dependent aminotransferase [uncultured Duncaniella sp.]|jgi:aspartate aminotransferase|uniref:pyridoxal phosphate-dependent aminotransferase n=1 Tax=uncultured Duncaniella sp. TaxID=2768039 RepID=UPI0026749810|nr:pyridoxal phosphate-dependent aminotransferase [uncultured Duncaniella sp.]MCI9171906.1 pyridoxal phosphate-dependent aminotransferase [Muribaculaceae bacterium]
MYTHVSERVNALAPSATLAMSQKSNELKAQGVDVINLSVGEPDFETPAHIKEAAKKAIDDNFTFYTPVPGYMSLRKAISEKLRGENGVEYAPEQITVSNGAKQALCNVILASINKGDEVIIPMPAWVSYVEMVKLAEGTPVAVHAGIDQDFKITPAQLEEAITPATRMILLCSPSNPTGSVYSREELQGLVNVLAKHPEILVLADEIYEHINFTGSFTSMASFPEIADRTVIINGVSKAYAMTGWRIGYSASPLWLAKAVNKLQGQYSSNASSIAQKAAEAAYTGSQECVLEMNKAFERRRNLVVELASQIPGLKVNRPAGAFYLFPEVSAYIGTTTPEGKAIASSADLAMYLLESGHVATVDGGAFGMEGYIRLSYATSDDNIREAMRRIAATLATLKK